MNRRTLFAAALAAVGATVGVGYALAQEKLNIGFA